MQNSSMSLPALSPARRSRSTRTCLFLWLSVLACWKVLPVPANPVTACSPGHWVVRCSACPCYSGLKTPAEQHSFLNAAYCLGLYMSPFLEQLLFFDIFSLFILQHLFQTPHVAVTSCFPASSPAGECVRSSCNVFSHLTFLSCLDNFCSLAHLASIFPKSGSPSSSSPSLQLWNCAAGHDLIIQMWSAEVKLHLWLVRFG